jgi:hypothetical protein
MSRKNPGKAGSSNVGYCRPPKEFRFVKGKSGNPNGRRRGSTSLLLLIKDELNKKVTVMENGKRRRMALYKAAAKQFIAKLLKGDPAFWKIWLNEPALSAPEPAEEEGLPDGLVELLNDSWYLMVPRRRPPRHRSGE